MESKLCSYAGPGVVPFPTVFLWLVRHCVPFGLVRQSSGGLTSFYFLSKGLLVFIKVKGNERSDRLQMKLLVQEACVLEDRRYWGAWDYLQADIRPSLSRPAGARRTRERKCSTFCLEKRRAGRRHLVRVQEPCESGGGRPGLSVLTSLMVSVDVKQY